MMVRLFGVMMFGKDIPIVVIGVAAAILFFGYVLVNRGSPHRVGFSADGVMHQCERCGRNYQPERVEKMDDGTEHRFIDDRCPHCGWDEDNNEPRFPI